MDIEFHYYITFILCCKAGYCEDDAYTIAYSSQYQILAQARVGGVREQIRE